MWSIYTLKGLSPICLFQFSSVSKQGIKIQESWERESYSISVEWMLYADCEVYLTGWVQWLILGGVRKKEHSAWKGAFAVWQPCSWPPRITFFCTRSIRQENCRPSWFVKITKNDTRSHASASAYRKMSLSTPSVSYTVHGCSQNKIGLIVQTKGKHELIIQITRYVVICALHVF